ncbi:MAG TPA: ATP-dependent helicase [Chloroflexi bacterium]|nr:ATP-dependent helicase [Chloroflexota bacterium]
MSILPLLSRWRADSSIGGNVITWETIPARVARYEPIPAEVHPQLTDSLRQNGIEQLYSHQAAAWQATQHGDNVAIVTGTASGKTLCYNLPVLDHLLREAGTSALYIFPTKALAQDQLAGLQDLLIQIETGTPIAPGTYDGDTSTSARPTVRQKSRLIITNPDMLHTGILPHHTRWEQFLRGLRFIVIDEMHTYRGVFGSHVANTLRRLKRLARFYGANPQIILTSATIGNPQALAEQLIEAPVTLIDEDGSARGQKHFLVYNPPIVDAALGIRASLTQETLRLLEDLLTYQIQTIVFGRTRRTVEIMLRSTKPAFSDLAGQSAVQAYRSGYLPRQRREIERGLRDGSIRAVMATSALELGIDIGQMEAAILAGYPGTIASAWQQAGRAGRGQDDSLAVLVTSASPLDQFLARHPEYFFGRSPEQALINPDHLLILLGHLQCAAFELPFEDGDSFGGLGWREISEFLEYLQENGSLHKSGEKYFWMAEEFPAAGISLRSASPNNIVLQTNDQGQPVTIGVVDHASAPWMVHPEAVYLHQGETFLVESLDLEENLAHLRRVEVDFYTRPQRETEIQLLELAEEQPAPGVTKSHGEILVTTQVVGYRKVRWGTNENLGYGEVSLPPMQLQTTGYWLALTDEIVATLQLEGLWNSAPNYYGASWPAARDAARARDGFRCQFCGLPENGRAHHVHHLKPFRAFASSETANRLENLVTLCPTCHLRAESAVRVRSGLAGLGYALENIAPLFLMCDSGDLGVHVDPKSPLADGRPTVVIYDSIPAGIGFSARLFELHADLMLHTREVVSACECSDGCPSCVGPGGEEGSGGKREALAILTKLS